MFITAVARFTCEAVAGVARAGAVAVLDAAAGYMLEVVDALDDTPDPEPRPRLRLVHSAARDRAAAMARHPSSQGPRSPA